MKHINILEIGDVVLVYEDDEDSEPPLCVVDSIQWRKDWAHRGYGSSLNNTDWFSIGDDICIEVDLFEYEVLV